MSKTYRIKDVPDDKVAEVMAKCRADGANPVTKEKQADGLWTIVAVYPNDNGE